MFTWICPKCGREVPPQYSECPDCERAGQASATGPAELAQPPVAAAPPPPPPEYRPQEPVHPTMPPPPPPAAQPQAPFMGQAYPAYAPPPPAPRGGMPTWLLTIVFALAIFGAVAGVYWLVGALKGGANSPAKQLATVESPAAKPGAKTSPLQKYIEVSGVRFLDEKKKPIVRFVITNHSGADLTGLTGNVTIWGRTQKSEEEAAGTFQFTTNLGPWETKDLTAPLTTKLAMIELPDWQNTTTDVQITGAQ